MKNAFRLIVLLCVLATVVPVESSAQEDGNKKERKRIWRRWRAKREAYNPYLDKKAKDKPSRKFARKEAKEQKLQRRRAQKEMRRSKRRLARENRRKAH